MFKAVSKVINSFVKNKKKKDTSKDSCEMFWTVNLLITLSPTNGRHKYNKVDKNKNPALFKRF